MADKALVEVQTTDYTVLMNRDGFSLLELLVVIAVIALLASIALPALRQGRNQGQEIVCAANLRQLCTATLVYAQENKTFPQSFCGLLGYGNNSPTGIQGDASYDWVGWWWFDFLADTLGSDASRRGPLWCPSRKITRGPDTDHVLCGNYGINASVCRIASLTNSEFLGVPLKSSNLSTPACTILLVDSGYAITSWKALSTDPDLFPFECSSRQNTYYLPGAGVNQNRSIHPDHADDAIEGRNLKNRLNVSYADGRVDRKQPNELSPDFDKEGMPQGYSDWLGIRKR